MVSEMSNELTKLCESAIDDNEVVVVDLDGIEVVVADVVGIEVVVTR